MGRDDLTMDEGEGYDSDFEEEDAGGGYVARKGFLGGLIRRNVSPEMMSS